MSILTPLDPIAGDTILPMEEARAHLNLTESDTYHDTALAASRDAAIAWAEGYTGLSLLARRFRWTTEGFSSFIYLPRGPIVSVDTLVYRATDGVDAALDETEWYLATDRLMAAHGTYWPHGDHVRIEFTAGLDDATQIPADLLAAVKLYMGHLFMNREAVVTGTIATEIPLGVRDLADRSKVSFL